MAPPQIDDTQLRTLHGQGHSQAEIARILGMPRSTVRDRLKKLDLASPTLLVPSTSTQSRPRVYNDMLVDMMKELQELVAWWQDRQATLQQSQEEGRETRRVTFFVEKRWEDAIRRQADLDGMTYTQIVNEAFRQYFERK
jgi:transposase